MDRIAGLMPQIGWSPLTLPATPKKAPASTVEPAGQSAKNQAGLGAEIDTRTPQDHAQAAREVAARLGSGAGGQADAKPPAPDPDAPTGPPPTFEMTQLQAEAARRKAGPAVAEPRVKDEANDTAPQADKTTEGADTDPTTKARIEARAETLPAPKPAPGRDWPALDAPEPHQVDVTR